MQATQSKSWRSEFESLALPAVLLLTGLILIGGDRVGVLSLDRIQNLWPVALILVGLSDLLTGGHQESPAQADPARSLEPSDISRQGIRRG